MAVHLDHLMVPSRNKIASAKLLALLLGVPWPETGAGPFVAVYVNDGLTFDFDEWGEPFPLIHYCFRVSEGDFDAILRRIKDVLGLSEQHLAALIRKGQFLEVSCDDKDIPK